MLFLVELIDHSTVMDRNHLIQEEIIPGTMSVHIIIIIKLKNKGAPKNIHLLHNILEFAKPGIGLLSCGRIKDPLVVLAD